MYLLDTNIVSELRKMENGKADANVAAWFRQVSLADAYLSIVTLFEIKVGILQLKRRDAQQAKILQTWFEQKLLPNFENRILPLDMKVMLTCAEFHIPDKKSLNDSYIAATAKAHRFKIVTRNAKDFKGCGVEVVEPFGVAK